MSEGALPALLRRRTARAVLIAAITLASVAFLSAGAFGGWWASVSASDSTRLAAMRTDVLRAAETAVQNLNTFDYRDFDGSLDRWLQSTTGDLHTGLLNTDRVAAKAKIAAQKSVSTAKILDGAVTELDDDQCKASVMVAIQLTVDGVVKRNPPRFIGDLAGNPTNGGCADWKLSGITEVPDGSDPTSAATAVPPTTSPTG
ncbi:MAG TPA: hypothetical protein VG317_06260 [Pseudonocardiaceae bacterium]|nr:hypothetical protein [Pseudonocardiaceae bacterium]